MSLWESLGIHQYRVEDDLLYWRPRGEVLVNHAEGVCALFSQLLARYGYVLWLVDAEQSIPVGFEVRRTYARWVEQAKGTLFVAAFRVALPAKTTAELIARGALLKSGKEVPLATFDCESEARAHLDMHRQQARALRGPVRT